MKDSNSTLNTLLQPYLLKNDNGICVIYPETSEIIYYQANVYYNIREKLVFILKGAWNE